MKLPQDSLKDCKALHILRVSAFATLLSLAPVGSAGSEKITDDLGFEVFVKDPIRRVVSLVPTNSEMVCLLDCERLKGGTRYDEFPVDLKTRIQRKQIEIVGGGFDANLEKIVQLQPDLILTNGPTQQRFAVPLKHLGYPVVSLWPRDLEGLTKSFLLLGRLLGRQEKALGIVEDLRQRFAVIEARVKNRPRKRVYLQMWTDPLITVGRHSFPDWLVRAAGGINIFNDMLFDSGPIALESLIRRNPDVLIFLTGQERFVKTVAPQPGWSSIRGVRDAHFCFIDEPDIRRSVGFLDGLQKIQRCLFAESK